MLYTSAGCSATWIYKREFYFNLFAHCIPQRINLSLHLPLFLARLLRKPRPSPSSKFLFRGCTGTLGPLTHKQVLIETVQLRPYNHLRNTPSFSCFAQESGMQITDICRIISDHTIKRIAFLINVQT